MFLSCSCFVNGQEKGTNKIIVSGVSFDSVIYKLLDAGYFIDKRDSTLKTVTTLPKRFFEKPSSNMYLQIRVRDSVAYITGMFNMDVVMNNVLGLDLTFDYRSFDPIENKGMKGSVMKISFIKMDEFAKSFNKPVEYKKE